ncbi:Protein-glutamate methylesterase/protein-glutamine glutaminase 5 [Candidatus Magnetomoraceae bacterium gMMP-1]
MSEVIRVLVVDDSAYVRKVVKKMLERSPFIEVVGIARDGLEALELVEKFQPDVVTLDLIMPVMNGVEFLKEQMARRPVPVVVVSIASETGEMTLKALDAGAIDFLQKPTALATDKIFEISDDLIKKVKIAATVPMKRLKAVPDLPPEPIPSLIKTTGNIDIIVIGISTGGPQALKFLIPQLPENFPVPLVIVLHMPVGYTKMYAESLDKISRLRVIEASEGDLIKSGTVFIAPSGRHLTFQRKNKTVVSHLDARPFDMLHRPSVDVLFQSASEIFDNGVLGIVMTGMGSDGTQGSAFIKAQGGKIFTEAEETCVVYGMPRSVDEAGLSDQSVSLKRMAITIIDEL